MVPVTLQHDDNSIQYEVLVDSGADICIFDAQLGELLGLTVEAGEKHNISGVTGVTEPYYIHEITIKVGGHPYKIKAGFLKNIAKCGYGVVGQKGFFDIFVVKFDLLKEEIKLMERKWK